jgi:hypothetical protein
VEVVPPPVKDPDASELKIRKELMEVAFGVLYEQHARLEKLHGARSPLTNRVASATHLPSASKA